MSTAPLKIGTEVDLSGASQMQSFAASVVSSIDRMVEEFAKMAAESKAAAAEVALGLKEMKHEAHEAELSFEELGEKGKQGMEALTKSIVGAKGAMGGFGAALGVGMIVELIDHMKEQALEAGHLAEATGISVKELVELKDAMNAAGTSSERLPQQMTKLASAMEEASVGGKKQSDAFAQLGIDVNQWGEKLPTATQVLDQLSDHMKGSEDSTRDLSALHVILGRNVVGLAGFLKQGSEAIEANKKAHAEHGEAIAQSVQYAKQLQAAETDLKASLETAVAPALKYVIDLLDGLNIMYKYVAAEIQSFGVSAIGVAHNLGTAWETTGKIIKDAIHLDWAAIKEDYAQGQREIQEQEKIFTDAQLNIYKERDTQIAAILNRPKQKDELEGPTRPSLAKSDESGAAQERLNMQLKIGEAKLKLAEEQAKAQTAMEGAEAKLQIVESQLALSKKIEDQRAFVSQLATLLEKSAEENRANETTAADAKLKLEENYWNQTIALHGSKSKADQKEREKAHGELKLIEIQHQEEMVKIDAQYEQKIAAAHLKVADEERKLKQREIATDIKDKEEALKAQEELINSEIKDSADSFKRQAEAAKAAAAIHGITRKQEYDQVLALYQQEEAAAKDLLEKKKALFIEEAILNAQKNGEILTQEEAARLRGAVKIDGEILAAHRRFLDDKQKLDEEAAARQYKIYQTVSQSFVKTMDQALLHAKSFHDAVAGIWQSMAQSFEQALMKMMEQWIMNMLLGKAMNAEASLATIGHSAATAAANTYAATSGVPIIGPVLAPVAAAAAFVAVMAFGAGIGSAAQGAVLPEDMMILAHKNEMILPPHISQSVQQMATGGGSSGGGDIHVHVSMPVHTMDSRSFGDSLAQHSRTLGDAISKSFKSGHIKIPASAR